MKLLLKKYLQSIVAVNVRNFLGIRPIGINTINLENNISISDSFFWRTDNNFSTCFKFSDILKIFYDINSSKAEMLFYDKNNNLIKALSLSDIELSNNLLLDKKFFGGIEDYGVFNIFHKSKKNINYTISNRCYTGYSYHNNLSSFVHGNTYVNYDSISDNKMNFGIIPNRNLKYSR